MYLAIRPFCSVLHNVLTLSTILLLHLPTTPAHPTSLTPRTNAPALPLPYSLIYQFPNPTWLENVAARRSGPLLTTLLTAPEVWQISPITKTTTRVAVLPGVLGCLGITEGEPDVFYVIAGNLTLQNLLGGNGTFGVFKVDFCSGSSPTSPKVSKVASIPGGVFLNGATTISARRGVILIVDSTQGVVYDLNVKTGQSSIAIDIPEMKPPPTGLPVGVNGLKIRKCKNGARELYFSNSGLSTFNRVLIDKNGKVVQGAKVELLAQGDFFDDFALDGEGNAWLTRNFENVLSVWVAKTGKLVDVLGSALELTVGGATACVFGRENGKVDYEKLFVVTSGDLAQPINGTVTEGGKVIAVDTEGFDG